MLIIPVEFGCNDTVTYATWTLDYLWNRLGLFISYSHLIIICQTQTPKRLLVRGSYMWRFAAFSKTVYTIVD